MIGPALRRVLVPAAMTLAAGVLIGFQAGRGSAPDPGSALAADLVAYHEAAVAALDLRPEQQRDLRVLLDHYQRERRKLLLQQLSEVDADWVALDRRFEALLLNRILDARQRRLAAQLQEPSAVAASSGPR